MKFNFLTPYPSKPGILPTGIKDLNIERMLRYFITDALDLRYILKILATFETNKDNIIYRQDLIKDLMDPILFETLTTHLNRLQSDFKDYDDLKDRFLKMTMTLASSDETQLYVILTQISKLCLNLLNTYKELNKILSNTLIKSDALLSLKDYLATKINQESFNELSNLLNQLATNKENAVQLYVTLNEQLQVIDCQMLDKTTLPKIKEGLFRKINVGNKVEGDSPTFTTLYKQALIRINEILLTIYEYFYAPFSQIKEDIKFYQFAFDYYHLLQEVNLNCVLPTIKEEETQEFVCFDLSDPLIAISAYKGHHSRIEVIPNTIKLYKKTNGILIRGENNTGKSVFLRSIGLALVFAQAGLFVCASEATISIRHKLFTLFSSKEDPQKLGGRFEKEVQFFANIIKEIDEYSFILINEIFQSTSSNEAENALIDILNYLTRRKTLWILVTHLTGIFNRRSELGDVRGLETIFNEIEKYKIKNIF